MDSILILLFLPQIIVCFNFFLCIYILLQYMHMVIFITTCLHGRIMDSMYNCICVRIRIT